MENPLANIRQGIAGSYSQVFFSDNRVLAGLLLSASFLEPATGASGLIAVVLGVLFANGLRLNPVYTHNGTYTFNVLLAGLAFGAYFRFSPAFFILLAVLVLLTLLITLAVASALSRYKISFLSVPFVLSVWILFLGLREFSLPGLEPRYLLEQLNGHAAGVEPLDRLATILEANYLPEMLSSYFHSLGAVFFQQNIFAGILVAAGLLYASRISFSLSLIGYFSGYFFFHYLHFSGTEMVYDQVGFNFILTAVGIGGFFLIPSWKSYLAVILSAPVTILLAIALNKFAQPYFLPIYSLPFSIVVFLVLILLGNRYVHHHLHLVQYQLYAPEKNLYAHHTYMERFRKDAFVHIQLPFYGEWTVSQGHSGNITHKDEWRFAWDFVVTDEEGKTFRMPGEQVSDFYCYSLPVLAPADGTVVTIADGIDDNEVGDVNLGENWGNTIVIRHGEQLYTKISHLKKDSFKVKEGEYVRKGDLIALCGNSGRSPEPHIHFQVQAFPVVGAKTIDYPIAYFVTKKDGRFDLHSFGNPEEGTVLLPPRPDALLQEAFHFIPGTEICFEVDRDGVKTEESWEVRTDALNNAYLWCGRTGSAAYFANNGTLFYFLSYTGDKKAFLYYFFLGAYKILLSYFEGLTVRDTLPVETGMNMLLRPVQDFIAPFHIFRKPVYTSGFVSADNVHSPAEIVLQTEVKTDEEAKDALRFEFLISEKRISKITITENNRCTTAEHI